MSSSKYYTIRSRSPTGDWNEGFVFVVTYHAQLFDTIEVKFCKHNIYIYILLKHLASLIFMTSLENGGLQR
ncbi:hypothetical protein CLU79DRAFT_701893 [Phycomyces nitens]|nr:hypothetical protein CLU79DRAFT_701893 [Phycomyces nitens]